jgi:hypothetical protein
MLLAALILSACAAEAETPELRPEFATRCGSTQSFEPGLERCENGVQHKIGPVLCVARPQGTRGHQLYQTALMQSGRGLSPECNSDDACTAEPHGYCAGGSATPLRCEYGCVSDDECGDGQLCACGDPVGRCVPASCTSDASCAPGYACTSWEDGCYGTTFSCESPEDECWTARDCGEGLACTYNGSRRVCVPSPTCSGDQG